MPKSLGKLPSTDFSRVGQEKIGSMRGGTPSAMPTSSKTCACQPHHFGKKILLTLVGVLVVYLVCLVWTMVVLNIKKYKFVGRADRPEHTITVTGYGKVTGKNDIAVTTLGYSNVDKDVAAAQKNNQQVMNQIMADLAKLGIAEKDLESNYSVAPEYNYTGVKGEELLGYRVTNSVTIKIRDLSKISAILSFAGKYGANQVGGLNFTIDEPEALKDEARQEAWADAAFKAQKLAAALGVRMVAVVSYSEDGGGTGYPIYYDRMAVTLGPESSMGPTPIASGGQDVSMNVNITYEIVPLQR